MSISNEKPLRRPRNSAPVPPTEEAPPRRAKADSAPAAAAVNFTEDTPPDQPPKAASFAADEENATCAITNKLITTNKVPSVILPEEIPFARLILRRDRSTHFFDIGRAVLSMHLNERACDCAVVCGRKRHLAHRVALAAHSSYFKSLLYSTGDQLPVDVPADGVQPRAMDDILTYIYSGDININFVTAMDVMASAQILQMKGLAERTCDFVDLILSSENLMTTLELAERSGAESLYAEAYKRLALNFYSQTKMTVFLLWDVDKVCRLLGDDNIIIETEMHIFIAAMRWMNYRRSERKVHFKRLMECVRWVYMTTEEVLKCVDMEQELVRSNDVRPVLIDATWYTTLKSYDVTWRDYPIPLPRVRFLRHEDPQTVVNRIRVSLASNRHPSFDTLWPTREAKHRPGSGRSKMRSLPSPGPHGNRFSNGTLTSKTTKSHRVYRSESGDFVMESAYAEAPRRSSVRRGIFQRGERSIKAPLSPPGTRPASPPRNIPRRNVSRSHRATHDGIAGRKSPGILQVAKVKLQQIRHSAPTVPPRPYKNR
ncbi:uncharacterized protein LOC129590141 [Paramacrobiotus metropolitanus]|uniref:uncharacterized protein LOC129590141 n=1 Tax=Paramacrobiotus metropolitanus TaxID=2943436 RepID=UPI0024465984|nr:uncharacterized protein LOC129590141 [Paramacrobiotus metropolitanus]XP_055341156.1 uncharacterized protein LOC129590141 [Paramacrobiotus metropolitanus]